MTKNPKTPETLASPELDESEFARKKEFFDRIANSAWIRFEQTKASKEIHRFMVDGVRLEFPGKLTAEKLEAFIKQIQQAHTDNSASGQTLRVGRSLAESLNDYGLKLIGEELFTIEADENNPRAEAISTLIESRLMTLMERGVERAGFADREFDFGADAQDFFDCIEHANAFLAGGYRNVVFIRKMSLRSALLLHGAVSEYSHKDAIVQQKIEQLRTILADHLSVWKLLPYRHDVPRIHIGVLSRPANSNCAGTNPELFFPGSSELDVANDAKRICEDNCRAKEECLAFAVEHRMKQGVWGGKTPSELRRYINKLNRAKKAEGLNEKG